MLMMAIARATDAEGACRLSTKNLAAAARMSRTSAWRLLGELQAKGWIVTDSPATKMEQAKIEVRLAKLEERVEVPQVVKKKAVPRCCRIAAPDRSDQQELVFPTTAAASVPEEVSLEYGLLLRRREAAAQQQRRSFSDRSWTVRRTGLPPGFRRGAW